MSSAIVPCLHFTGILNSVQAIVPNLTSSTLQDGAYISPVAIGPQDKNIQNYVFNKDNNLIEIDNSDVLAFPKNILWYSETTNTQTNTVNSLLFIIREKSSNNYGNFILFELNMSNVNSYYTQNNSSLHGYNLSQYYSKQIFSDFLTSQKFPSNYNETYYWTPKTGINLPPTNVIVNYIDNQTFSPPQNSTFNNQNNTYNPIITDKPIQFKHNHHRSIGAMIQQKTFSSTHGGGNSERLRRLKQINSSSDKYKQVKNRNNY